MGSPPNIQLKHCSITAFCFVFGSEPETIGDLATTRFTQKKNLRAFQGSYGFSLMLLRFRFS
jgi:hypothetical protein